MEFRSFKDDAWYEATLQTELSATGHLRLRVKFATFSDAHDELVKADDLKSLKDVDALRFRVRKISPQLQDYECSQLKKGSLVCAARSVRPDDRRFYDGVIRKVERKQHSYKGGEEVCSCGFVVEWITGPDTGVQTNMGLEHMCRVEADELPTKEVSPVLGLFLDKAKEKIATSLYNSITTVVEKGAFDLGTSGKEGAFDLGTSGKEGAFDFGTSRLSKRFKDNSALPFKKDTPAKRYIAELTAKANASKRCEHDRDIGGVLHGLYVENLEKDISPVTIIRFVYQQVSVSCKAFVMPSKQLEPFTRGVIILEKKKNVEKLSSFLESPDHIIVSSRGRPWVVLHKSLSDDTLREMTEVFRHTSGTASKSRTPTSNELKVAISGSREYEKAKMLKNLFKELSDHQSRVHKSKCSGQESLVRFRRPHEDEAGGTCSGRRPLERFAAGPVDRTTTEKTSDRSSDFRTGNRSSDLARAVHAPARGRRVRYFSLGRV